MRHSTEAGFDSTGHHWDSRKGFAAALGVDISGTVRPLFDGSSGGVCVLVAPLAIGGVVVDHRVHVPRADREEEAWGTQTAKGLGAAPVGLGQDSNPQAFGFEYSPKKCRCKGGMVHIGISARKDYVELVPPTGPHFLLVGG